MKKLRIQGGRRLRGEIQVSGAKNAALPALAAAILTDGELRLDRVPSVVDIRTMARLLESIGSEVERSNGGYTIRTPSIRSTEASYELVKTMRASSLVLGPLTARAGRARVSIPGGCAIGARPIDLHLKGLERLGAEIHQEAGYIEAIAPKGGLRGAQIVFPKVTVTGTEDLMMAAALARGESILENAAREPEVEDLAALMTTMGAKIKGAGTSTIRVEGVERLSGGAHTVAADRIEAGTYLIAAAIAGDDVLVRGLKAEHLGAVLEKLEQAGVRMEHPSDDEVRVLAGGRLRAVDVTTQEHPGFPTDMQAQWMALMTQAEGESNVVETIFENRFMHVSELTRMGADIHLEGHRAIVRGGRPLSGATVMASDLRASASLVLAALAAEGETVIDRVYHLDRGYERMEEKLSSVGAAIERFSE